MRNVSTAAVMATDVTLIGVCLVFVALRCYVRIRILHKFDASDALAILAWCMFVVTCAGDFNSERLGFWDPHIQFTRSGALPDFEKYIKSGPSGIKKGLKVIYACQPITMLVVYSVKMSFLLLYRQIFSPEMRKLRVALNVTFVVVILAFVSGVCMGLFWCMPISRNWSSNPAERCMAAASVTRYTYVIGCNILTDLLVYILPFFLIPTLYRCTSSRRHFAGIIGIFSLGFLSIACSVAKILLTVFGASATTISIWGTAEQGTAIVVVCCPPLRYLASSARSKSTKPTGDKTTAGAQTKTNWRFWRMGGSSPRDIESTVDTFGADTIMTVVETEMGKKTREKEIMGGGLAPAPIRTQSEPWTNPKSDHGADVNNSKRDEAPVRRASRWRQVLRVETSTSATGKGNGRKGNSTFGGTQYSAQQANTEHPTSPISPVSPISRVPLASPVSPNTGLQNAPRHLTVATAVGEPRSVRDTMGWGGTFTAESPVDIEPAQS